MDSFETLEFGIKNRIAFLTLSRPDQANSVTQKVSEDLAAAASLCAQSQEVKAVLISAKGPYFCVGGDIKEMQSHGDKIGPKIKSLADNFHAAMSTFARLPAPVITAVNGMAAGAGFSLAISGDIVLASENAAFQLAYTKAGLSPDGSASYTLPRLIGLRRAQEMMLTNRQLSAQDAKDWGLITEVIEPESLQARALEVANAFAKGPARANAAVKTLLLASFGNDLETQMDLEAREISICASAPDGRRGINAFVAKQKPEFD